MKRSRSFVQKISIPSHKQACDSLLDTLAGIWNESGQSTTAQQFILGPTSERSKLLYQSIWRFKTDEERYRMAQLLLQLADAVYSGAIAPWVK